MHRIVAKNVAPPLKIYRRSSARLRRPSIDSLGSLPEVLQAFRASTGWQLRYNAGEARTAPRANWSANLKAGETHLGQFTLAPPQSDEADHRRVAHRKAIDEPTARVLASAISGMVTELIETRHALWQREAELAAGVPLIPHAQEQAHLAARLEAVIKAGTEAVECNAAALYLLDEATTHLKLRSCWGLPLDRLIAKPRPLQGAVADLEALLGHAVVLDDAASTPQFPTPEDFPSAACVPVSTPTSLLGTLWVFSNRKRDFTSQQTNLLEIVAGRVAADLEREMLLGESLTGAQLKRDLAAAERLQRNQLPSLSPMLDGWQLAGWASQARGIGGAFYDWFCRPAGLVAFSLGQALDGGSAAALPAATLRAALRAHGQYHRLPHDTLTQANLTLWTGSAGDQTASGLFGLLDTASGVLQCAAAGHIGAIRVRPGSWQCVGHSAAQLGEGPETTYLSFAESLEPGEAMIFHTASLRDATDEAGRPFGDSGLGEPAAANPALSADALVELLSNRLLAHTSGPEADRALLVVRRAN